MELRLRIDVSSSVVALALVHVAQESGWAECDHDAACRCLVVADHLPRAGQRVDVLVAHDEPASCQQAIDAALCGLVKATILWNDPESLAATCESVRAELAVIPTKVLELAARAPRLTERQRQTLRLMAAGRSTRAIGHALHQSESTAKRDIAELLVLFDAPNRTVLIRIATELGFLSGSPPSPRAALPRPPAQADLAISVDR